MKISLNLFFLLLFPAVLCSSDRSCDLGSITKEFQEKVTKALSKNLDKRKATEFLAEAVTYPGLDATIFEQLVERGACVNFVPGTEQDPYRHTLVHRAVICNNPTALDSLLKNHAGVNSCVGWHLRTPLHIASILGNDRAIALLLQYAANPCIPDRNGQIPLQMHQFNAVFAKILQDLKTQSK